MQIIYFLFHLLDRMRYSLILSQLYYDPSQKNPGHLLLKEIRFFFNLKKPVQQNDCGFLLFDDRNLDKNVRS